MEGKNIVLCCDGTGNEYSKTNTNIVKIVELSVQNSQQIIFYDPGVGTHQKNLFGKAFGHGLLENVLDGYKFLMHHYAPNDHLFIFGFSRGAFTARFLAALLCEWGLLKPGSYNLIPYISKYLKNEADSSLAPGFKKTFCNECIPYFLGMFDTVKSLGALYGTTFPNYKLHKGIKYAYHALALDEKRKHFQPALWDESDKGKNQTIEQVWFSGVHCDIGGGYDQTGLSDICLKWVLEAAKKCGLLVSPNWEERLNPNPLAQSHHSNSMAWKAAAMLKPSTPNYRILPKRSQVHHSVITKCEQDPTYDPKNLMDYKIAYNHSPTDLNKVAQTLDQMQAESTNF